MTTYGIDIFHIVMYVQTITTCHRIHYVKIKCLRIVEKEGFASFEKSLER
jgi:hypothetical protein